MRMECKSGFRWCFMSALILALLAAACTMNPQKRKATFVRSADKYASMGDFNKAIIQYRNALRIDPTSADIHYKLGQAFFQDGQFQESYRELLEAGRLNPEHVPTQLALAGLYVLAGRGKTDPSEAERNFDEAIRTARSILDKHPDEMEAELFLASAYAGKNDFPHAVAILQQVIATHADYVPAYLELGMMYAAQRKMDDAKAQFEKALALNPKSVPARQTLASYYLSQGHYDQAEEEYRAAVNNDPNSAEARTALADFYFVERNFSAAEQTYGELVKMQGGSLQARFSLANFYFNAGRFDDARKLYAEIAKEKPTFLAARLQLAEVALRRKNLDEANGIVSEILKDRPKEPSALMLQARILLLRKDPEKALESLGAAEHLDPNVPTLHFLKGLAYTEEANPDLAQHSFEAAIGLNPGYTDAYVALSQLLLNRAVNASSAEEARADTDIALRYAQQALTQQPNRAEARLLAGSAELNLGEGAKAEAEFQEFAKLQPDSAQGPARLGMAYRAERRYDLAGKEFERALTLDPKDLDSLMGLVSVYNALGQKEKAPARIKQQIAQNETAPFYDLLGKTYADLGQTQPAEGAFKRAIELDPQSFTSYAMLGALYAQEKALDRAIAEFEAGAKLKPGNPGVWTELGSLYQDLGQADRAQQAYEKALQIDPNLGMAANNLAWLLCEKEKGGDLDRALDLARRAKVAMPQVATVSDTLGWIYYKSGLYGSAIPVLQEAVREEPQNGDYRLHLAASLLGSGKKREAQSELQAALKLDQGLRQRRDYQQIFGKM
jgi:tetratricopeptide (TPR) repeat protein